MPISKLAGKKDGKQKYKVRVNFTDNIGNHRSVERIAYGLDEAKSLEMKLAKDVSENMISSNMTVQELYDEYINVKRHEVRESSLDKSVRILSMHVLNQVGKIQIGKLSLKHLQNWKLMIEDKGLSLRMKQNIYGEFRALLNYGVRMEYINRNPLIKIGNFKSALFIKKDMDYYTAEEFKKFIAVARQCAEKSKVSGSIVEWSFYVFFAIAFYTGLRKGEIHGLQWCDINGAHLSVRRSIAQKLKGEDRITPPKNKSSVRTLQLPQPLIEILSEHNERCNKINGFNEQLYVCGGFRSLRDTTIQNKNKEYAELAGVKVIRIHDFRHSHASLLANEGINIQEIARRLGHSKIEITWNTYSHLYPREEERAIEILNKIRG